MTDEGLFPDPRPSRTTPTGPPPVHSRGAEISADGVYRYSLTRVWGSPFGTSTVFVMLNPSTADADIDDPTIRRCMGFARAWGSDGLTVLNLYGLRSTDPRALRTHPDPVGPANDLILARAFDWAAASGDVDALVAAWGGNAEPERAAAVIAMAEARGVPLQALTINRDGTPKHPLYIAADTIPIPLAREARTIPRSTP